jgi:DNA-binding NarL/FixJ family response regulator
MSNIQQTHDIWSKLTPREVEIVRAAAAGASIKQTAADLGISHFTVQNHRRRVIWKLACGNITNAVGILLRAGIIL